MNENSNLIVVFYGELTTKGKNIRDFINLLGKNIRSALKNFKNLTYDIRRDHIYIHLNGEDYNEIKKALEKVPGIGSFALAVRVDKTLDALKE